jgi:hypothetical protein
LGMPECVFFGLPGKARRRGMAIPFKEEQRRQTAQKTRNRACSAFSQTVRVIKSKISNSQSMSKTPTSGQLRFSG